jgi:hypothetical protein
MSKENINIWQGNKWIIERLNGKGLLPYLKIQMCSKDGAAKGTEGKGKERLLRYSDLITNSKYLNGQPNYRNSVYFFEPFYQLMRQTLWAEQMIQHKDNERIKANNYIHIHIIPNENKKLLYKNYKISKNHLREIWLSNLKDKEKYIIISPFDFMKNIDNNKYGDLLKYLVTIQSGA